MTPALHAGETALDEILALSASMLDLAQAQDWIGVANLEVTRDALLKAVFEGTDRPSPEALGVVVRQVLEKDRELIALGTRARDAVAGELTQLRQVHRAHAAYSEHEAE